MMDNRKKIGLLIISVAVLILAIIIILLLKKTDPAIDGPVSSSTPTGNLEVSEIVVAPTSTPGDKPRNYQTYNVSKELPYELNSNDVAKTASLFATRFGSFSNQSDYGNVTDLKIFMTDSMKEWADKYVAELKSQKYSGEYYGIITHALTTKVLSYDENNGKSKIEVTAERQENKGDTLGTAYQQKMTIDLVKVGNEWLVDNAVWEK